MSDALRAQVAQRLMRALRRPQREVGERALGHFVIALEDDSVGFVCKRVESVGGSAQVVVAMGADLHLFCWEQADDTDTPIYDGVERQPVDPRTPMAMLIELVTSVPSSSHAFRVEECKSVRLFDKDRLLAPA